FSSRERVMDGLRYWLVTHGFALFLVGIAFVLGVIAWFRWMRRQIQPVLLLVVGCSLPLLGLGGRVRPSALAGVLAGVALAALFIALLVVVVTGRWSALLGFLLGGSILLGLGGLGAEPAGSGLVETGRVLLKLEAGQPEWLALLALVPLIVWLSFRSLAGLGPVRRWLAI